MVNLKRIFGLSSHKLLLGSTLGAALVFMVVGVVFWGGFNTAMEATNTLTFCISCHEMEQNVYQEYTKTIHYTNRSGVRATCSDCHVPDPWVHKFMRKIKASNELFHKVLGSIDTPEKFDAKRLQLAKSVWRTMKSTDSRECRNCHNFDAMNPEDQKKRSRREHASAMEDGSTCIDCHKGIAHKKVHDQLSEQELEDFANPLPENKRPIAPQWQAFIDNGKKLPVDESEPIATTSEQAPQIEAVVLAPVETGSAAASPDSSGVDWSAIEPAEITLFYPGQASMEWMLKGSDHGGKRGFTKGGDRCFDCHEDEEVDIGEVVASGEKLEATPIPGKRGSIPVSIQAAHDADNLYMRFQWEDGEHAPVPFVDGGKMDPENPIKLAIMLATDLEENPQVEFAERSGCWQTCHHDANYMPHQPEKSVLSTSPLAQRLDLDKGFTKYLKESRSEIEIEGKNDKKRGGWNNLKDETELQNLLAAGTFMDLLRYKSGTGESEDGYILAERVMVGGQGVEFTGALNEGIWTIEMTRKLLSDQPGDVSLSADQWYNIGFAIHDDFSDSRFHHVSLGFKLGFDDEDAEINAIRQ